MRSWWRFAMLAWVTAVFAVTPVQAALACRVCCARHEVVAAKKSGGSHSCCSQSAAGTVTVRQAAFTAPRTTERPCQGCPQCERTRPVPVTPVPSAPVLVDSRGELAHATLPQTLADVSPASMFDPRITPRRTVSSHGVCAVLCRWLT